MPVPAERRVVLTYFVSLLSGRRRLKKFPVFTDERDGDNGKTTMMQLFILFYGAYAESSGTKFVCRGSFDRDRDSHDAGTELLRSKRLIVAEELKSTMTLDEALLKRLSGGSGVNVGGRRLGTNDRWQFVWQAGFAMIFNQGGMPKFDNSDTAFIARVFVVPMRAKFVDAGSSLSEPYTFEKRLGMEERFGAWLPAVMDVLLDHYGVAGVFDVGSLPPAMQEWRREVTSASSPVTRWCDEFLEVTGDPDDCVVLGDAMRLYTGTPQPKTKDEFARLVRGCFDGVQEVTFHATTTLANPRVTKRLVLRGVRLRQPALASPPRV